MEAEQNGQQPHGRFSVTCIDFMIELQQGWLETEKEVLGLEIAFRKLPKAKQKASTKGKKRV